MITQPNGATGLVGDDSWDGADDGNDGHGCRCCATHCYRLIDRTRWTQMIDSRLMEGDDEGGDEWLVIDGAGDSRRSDAYCSHIRLSRRDSGWTRSDGGGSDSDHVVCIHGVWTALDRCRSRSRQSDDLADEATF